MSVTILAECSGSDYRMSFLKLASTRFSVRKYKNIPVESMIVDKDNLEEMKKKFPAALGL